MAQHEGPFLEKGRERVGPAYGVDGQSQSRQIEDEYPHDSRGQLVEQFEGLAAIGGKHVEEHVGGDDGVAEKIKQYQLECPDEVEREQRPRR